MHEIRDVHHVTERFAHAGIFQLFKQRPGEAHVQPRDIPILIKHPGHAVIAPKNLPRLPTLAGIMQRHQIPQRLVHVQTKRVIDFSHAESPTGVYRHPQAKRLVFRGFAGDSPAMEIVFTVTQESDGGYVAECLSHDIFTQGNSWEELRANVREAVSAFFFDQPKPAAIRLHLVKDELLAGA